MCRFTSIFLELYFLSFSSKEQVQTVFPPDARGSRHLNRFIYSARCHSSSEDAGKMECFCLPRFLQILRTPLNLFLQARKSTSALSAKPSDTINSTSSASIRYKVMRLKYCPHLIAVHTFIRPLTRMYSHMLVQTGGLRETLSTCRTLKRERRKK